VAIIHGTPDSDKPRRPQGSRGYKGKKGEEKVLKKLKELDDSFHILCNVKLGYDVLSQKYYKGRAQIDFVIVSKRGIVSMEVKHWSDEYYTEHKKYGYPSPHLQADGTAKKLWIDLHSFPCFVVNPPVSRVLLGTYGNLQYDPQFKFVNVKDLNNINNFLQNQIEKLSEDNVRYVVDYLLMYVPNSELYLRLKKS